MNDHSEGSAPASDRAAQWHREAAYHLARAAQERRLAARSTSPEVQAAHASLAQTHLTRAGSAEMAATTPDVAPVHADKIKTIGAVMRESFGLPSTDD